MKIFGALTLVTVTLLPLSARAETRGTDAALGAVSGALVFGPVGAVAGAVVGFTAGPAIGKSWGANRNARYRARTRPKEMQSRTAPDQAAPSGAVVNRTGQASAPAVPADNSVASAQAGVSAAPANAPTAQVKTPPVQGFE